MKPASKLTDQQKAAAAIAAKQALSTPVTEFMDRVSAILDEYDERDAALVTERPRKHS